MLKYISVFMRAFRLEARRRAPFFSRIVNFSILFSDITSQNLTKPRTPLFCFCARTCPHLLSRCHVSKLFCFLLDVPLPFTSPKVMSQTFLLTLISFSLSVNPAFFRNKGYLQRKGSHESETDYLLKIQNLHVFARPMCQQIERLNLFAK